MNSLLGKADEENVEHKHADENALNHITRPLQPLKATKIIQNILGITPPPHILLFLLQKFSRKKSGHWLKFSGV